jgi:ClpP class serine protease
VIALRLDITRALEEMGIKITTLQFGEQKTDTYPTTPLSNDARDRLQADIDALGIQFVDLVARNRGMRGDDIRDMEAATFLGSAGVESGLADAVASPEEALSQW